MFDEQSPSRDTVDGFFVAIRFFHSLFHCSVNSMNVVMFRLRMYFCLLVLFSLSWIADSSAQIANVEQGWEIQHINFRGNSILDEGTLRQVIQLRESQGFFSKLFGKMTGEDFPSDVGVFQSENLIKDKQRLADFYQDHGFYHTEIENEVSFDSSNHRVNVLFIIQENKQSFIDRVFYRGFEVLDDDLKKQLNEEPRLQSGMVYERTRVPDEIKRILTILVDHGYRDARYEYDSSGAYEYLSSNNYKLIFTFVPGRQYYFSDVHVRFDPPRSDITENIVLRQLDFKAGDLFSFEKKASSERGLNRLGIFEEVRIEQDTVRESSSSTNVPMAILVRPRARNELAPELIVSNQGDELNLGLGLGYTDRNFFGDARSFNANVRARTQSLLRVLGGQSFSSPQVVAALDLQIQVVQPYFFSRTLSGSIVSNFILDKEKAYVLYISRSKLGLNKQFATYTMGSLDWTLERNQPVIDSSVQVTLRDDEKAQFNSILTFSLQRDKTNDPFSPTEGFYHSMTIEESGILPGLLHANPLSYTEYYKLTLFGRWYHDLSTSHFNILALKARAGYQDKYGESRSRPVNIPLNRRFYSGGSGSLRGWRARELGVMPDELLQFGGNFTLEGSLEMRVNHFRQLSKWAFIRFENVWGVYFLDFGNTWRNVTDVRLKDVAIAAGLGFRYETVFGPFRVDYGVRVYDPKGEFGHQTIFKKRFLSETLSSGVVQLGIGHAF